MGKNAQRRRLAKEAAKAHGKGYGVPIPTVRLQLPREWHAHPLYPKVRAAVKAAVS